MIVDHGRVNCRAGATRKVMIIAVCLAPNRVGRNKLAVSGVERPVVSGVQSARRERSRTAKRSRPGAARPDRFSETCQVLWVASSSGGPPAGNPGGRWGFRPGYSGLRLGTDQP